MSKVDFEYNQNDLVYYNNGHIKGYGRIVGYLSPAYFGYEGYIIQTDENFPTEVYPFNTFTIEAKFISRDLFYEMFSSQIKQAIRKKNL